MSQYYLETLRDSAQEENVNDLFREALLQLKQGNPLAARKSFSAIVETTQPQYLSKTTFRQLWETYSYLFQLETQKEKKEAWLQQLAIHSPRVPENWWSDLKFKNRVLEIYNSLEKVHWNLQNDIKNYDFIIYQKQLIPIEQVDEVVKLPGAQVVFLSNSHQPLVMQTNLEGQLIPRSKSVPLVAGSCDRPKLNGNIRLNQVKVFFSPLCIPAVNQSIRPIVLVPPPIRSDRATSPLTEMESRHTAEELKDKRISPWVWVGVVIGGYFIFQETQKKASRVQPTETFGLNIND
tara:strand:+ start:121968 stop:122843 length:876 start_codon:yes stop_codon:yes gene_type:complete